MLPGLLLAAAVVLMTAMSLLGSVFLGGTANGIAIFMLFIAGLVAGLLGSIGHALGSHTISRRGHGRRLGAAVRSALSGRAQADHDRDARLHRVPRPPRAFGGAYNSGWGIRLWALAYLVIVGVIALTAFARRDL